MNVHIIKFGNLYKVKGCDIRQTNITPLYSGGTYRQIGTELLSIILVLKFYPLKAIASIWK